MTTDPHPTWRKSSYSGTQGGNCVEMKADAVRDSKNPTGPILAVSVVRLVHAVKAGRYDR